MVGFIITNSGHVYVFLTILNYFGQPLSLGSSVLAFSHADWRRTGRARRGPALAFVDSWPALFMLSSIPDISEGILLSGCPFCEHVSGLEVLSIVCESV